MVMAELFSVDAGLEERVMNRENVAALSAYLRECGMKTLAAEGLRLAAEGKTTMTEVEREIALV
jgi:type II secretory ATPase GspE/PulE/Tfp pilus assembly ATPase PilB-like protein